MTAYVPSKWIRKIDPSRLCLTTIIRTADRAPIAPSYVLSSLSTNCFFSPNFSRNTLTVLHRPQPKGTLTFRIKRNINIENLFSLILTLSGNIGNSFKRLGKRFFFRQVFYKISKRFIETRVISISTRKLIASRDNLPNGRSTSYVSSNLFSAEYLFRAVGRNSVYSSTLYISIYSIQHVFAFHL